MSQNLKHFLIALPLTVVLAFGGFVGVNGYTYFKEKDTQREVRGEREELKIGTTSDILGIYPDLEENEITTLNINSNFLEALTTFDDNFRVKPLLAENWNNPDDKTWRVYLKKNVKFHNGETFKSSDVKFTIDYLKEKESPIYDYFTAVETFNIIDDYTIELKTKDPYPILMNKLANVSILSEKAIKANGTEKPIGTGPYKFVEWVKNDHLTLQRNENYHGEKPKIKKVTYLPSDDDEEALIEKLKKKEVDFAEITDGELAKKVSEDKTINKKTISDFGVSFLMINYKEGKLGGTSTSANPFLDKRVRQALYYGIDIESFIKAGGQSSVSADQLTTKNIFGYNTAIKRYSYDINKAKQLLKEAGFENGFETTVILNPANKAKFEELATQLAKIGIKLTLDLPSSMDEYFGKVSQGQYSLAALSWNNDSGDSSDLIESFLNSEGESNLSGYSNEKIDELSKKSSSTMDQKKRKDYLGEALKIASDDAVFIPLDTVKRFFVFKEGILFEPRADTLVKPASIAEKKFETVKKPSFVKYLLSKAGIVL